MCAGMNIILVRHVPVTNIIPRCTLLACEIILYNYNAPVMVDTHESMNLYTVMGST